MSLFQSKREDGRAEWRVVFDLVDALQPGEVITHEILLDALETDDRAKVYRAVQRAMRELWSSRSRSLGVVKGVGYRVLRAEEHELQANGYRRQARRRQGNAVAVIDATDLSALTSTQREWMIKVQAGMHLIARAMDSHAKQLARHDDLIASLQSEVAQLRGGGGQKPT